MMWCRSCKQDVPAVAHLDSDTVVCTRCHHELRSADCAGGENRPEVRLHDAAKSSAATAGPPGADQNDWLAEQRMRRLARVLRMQEKDALLGKSANSAFLRFDPPRDLGLEIERLAAAPQQAPAARPAVKASYSRTRKSGPSRAGQWTAWLLTLAGLAVFAGGAGLAVWSQTTGPAAYWNWGLGAASAGQGLLIVALVLLLSRLWRSSRQATQRLHEVVQQLGQVQRASEAALGRQSPSTQTFYADLSTGASPHVLLGNLRGQMDQLSRRLQS